MYKIERYFKELL